MFYFQFTWRLGEFRRWRILCHQHFVALWNHWAGATSSGFDVSEGVLYPHRRRSAEMKAHIGDPQRPEIMTVLATECRLFDEDHCLGMEGETNDHPREKRGHG